jgi:hypothetical protein
MTAQTASSSIVRRVDHLPVFVSDPRPLFRALTERLGLPVLVPVARWTGLESGLVGFGSVYLEVVRIAPGRRLPVPLDQGAIAVALEPEPVELAVAGLARRSIPHGPPVPYLSPAPGCGRGGLSLGAVPSASSPGAQRVTAVLGARPIGRHRLPCSPRKARVRGGGAKRRVRTWKRVRAGTIARVAIRSPATATSDESSVAFALVRPGRLRATAFLAKRSAARGARDDSSWAIPSVRSVGRWRVRSWQCGRLPV